MRVWRITTKRHATTAFSGVGNKKAGSRWVPTGISAVYTSEHISTAVLENLVHMDPSDFRDNHVLIAVDIPDDLPKDVVSITSLPVGWESLYEDDELQAVGKDWVERGDTSILVVPAAVARYEQNIIINPLHPDFKKIITHKPETFRFDGRLVKK